MLIGGNTLGMWYGSGAQSLVGRGMAVSLYAEKSLTFLSRENDTICYMFSTITEISHT